MNALGDLPAGAISRSEMLEACFRKLLSGDARSLFINLTELLVVALTCGVTLWIGLPHTSIYGHDLFVLLDGSWRVLAGQRPHVDFYSPLGPVFYLLGAAGLRVAHFRVDGLADSVVMAGVALGVWAAALARTRLGGLSAILFLSFAMFFWVAPFPLGEPYYLPSYAMLYNRLGYVLVALILVDLFTTSRRQNQKWDIDWGGISSGIAIGLLLFLKASFFFVAVALVLLAYVVKAKSPRHLAFVAAGFFLICCAMFSYLHWDIAAFWNDQRIAMGARQKRFNPAKDLIRIPLRNTTPIATLLGLVVLIRSYVRKSAMLDSVLLRNAGWITAGVLAADFLLALSNQQRYGFPLAIVAILLLGDAICRVSKEEKVPLVYGTGVFQLVVALTVLPFVFDTVNAWLLQPTVRANTQLSTAARINSSQMDSLIFDDHVDPVWDQREANGHLLANSVNDGLALLRAHSGSNDHIACLCFANPFAYALQREPQIGGSPNFDYGTNFTERFSPSAESILGNADLVIYPKLERNWPTVATLLKKCDALLSRNYRPYVESEQWVVLKRIRVNVAIR